MSGYIGNIPVPQATQSRETFTATSGQTSFATVGYTPNFLDVYLNGVHLVNGDDYTATNGSDVVLTVGAAAGDTIEVISHSTFEVNSQTFTGTTTADNLTVTGAFTSQGIDDNATSTAMTLDSSGNLLVGTTSNSQLAKLNIQGGYAFIKETGGADVYLRSGYDDGTVAAIQVASASPLVFATNNTDRMRIDSSGNLGLGVTPSAWDSSILTALQVRSASLSSVPSGLNDTYLSSNAYYNGSWKYINTSFATQYRQSNGSHIWSTAPSGTAGAAMSLTEVARIDSSGNVGIGTSSPSRTLSVVDATSDGSGGILVQNYLPAIELDDASGGGTSTIIKHDGTNTIIENGGTGRLRIDSSGSVLIKTSSHTPTDTELVVSSEYSASGTTDAGITLSARQSGNWRNSGIFANGAALTFTTGDTGVNGAVSTSEKMRIDSSGSLLVGTTTSAGAGGVGLTGKLKVGYQGNLGGFGLEDATGLYFSGSSSTGFTAVNSSNNNAAFYVSLSTSATTGTLIHFADTGSGVGSISTNGTSTSYNTSSDYRLKENVVDLTGATDRLKQIPVHRFNFIADADTTVDGFLAHEVQAIVPEAVTGTKDEVDADGNAVYQGIDQSKLVPLLTAALQEAVDKIEALEARLTAANL